MKNKNGGWKNSDTTKTIIFCGIVLILFWLLLNRFSLLTALLSKILHVLRPVIIGGFIALVLNNPVNKLGGLFQKPFDKLYDRQLAEFHSKKRSKEPKKITGAALGLSIFVCYVLALAFIGCLIAFVVPEFTKSLVVLNDKFDDYFKGLENLVYNILDKIDSLNIEKLDTEILLNQLGDTLKDIPAKLLGEMPTIGKYTQNILLVLFDILMGIIFSIYILVAKKQLKISTKKLGKKIFSEKVYKVVGKYLSLTIKTFENFFNGQLLEAYILGMLCFIGMTIFGFKYAVVISVIIGVTNMIPIVGPWLGSIPCVALLLLVEPSSVLWFILYIVILQQLESNLIYPRVVGTMVNLPELWVLLAIVIGGGFFDVMGMIVGVPVMSIIYYAVTDYVNKEDKEKIDLSDIDTYSE